MILRSFVIMLQNLDPSSVEVRWTLGIFMFYFVLMEVARLVSRTT